MSDNLKEVLKSLVTVLPSIIAIIAVYWNTWSEKNKKRYERIQNKRETYFEPFIQQCALLIVNPEKVFEENYISELNTLKAKVLLYADKSLFYELIQFTNKYQNILDKYKKTYIEKEWDFNTRYTNYIKDDFPVGENRAEVEYNLQENIRNEIKSYKDKHIISSHEISKDIDNICEKMRRNLESIK